MPNINYAKLIDGYPAYAPNPIVLTDSYGVVPAFAIPQSVMLEDSANTDGSYNLIL